MTKPATAMTIDDCRELVILRTKAAKFFIALLWFHVPVVLTMAVLNHMDWRPQAAVLVGLLILPTYFALRRPATLATRLLIAIALTAMPIMFVFDNTGRLQIDFHMYFFAVFAMLMAFVDWRPIVVSAALTSVHHLIFNFIDRSAVFPTEGGIGRVALHAVIVGVECGVLIWAISLQRKLFLTAERTQELAEANAELEASKRRLEQSTVARIEGLERVALTDSLTQLGNRRAFTDDFAREIARAQRHNHPLTLALVDIDDFKELNDKNGHKFGDDSLTRLARLFRTLRKEDRAYRVGGDEFALVFVDTNAPTARAALERLRDEARNTLLGASISIGYVGLDASQLANDPYELADAALYEAKKRGRNTVVNFDEVESQVTIQSPRKVATFKRLIDEELLDIAFQPIWDIASCKPLGFEALARPHVELGFKGPGELFGMAAAARMLPQLDRCCNRKAFAASKNLPPGSKIFVKVTPASLEHADFNAHGFAAAARACGLLPQQIVIEVGRLETSGSALLVARLDALAALGVNLALGNVTTDSAALEILKKSRFDYVKIDHSVMNKALTDSDSSSAITRINAVARDAGIYVIAEGVENSEIFEFACRDHNLTGGAAGGIRGVQGYLLGRPSIGVIDVADLHTWGKFLSAHFIKLAV